MSRKNSSEINKETVKGFGMHPWSSAKFQDGQSACEHTRHSDSF